MGALLGRALTMWADDDRIRTVLISGGGERGLCAGSDLRAMHADAVSGGTGITGFLGRRVPAQRRDRRLPEAGGGVDGRAGHGRRRRGGAMLRTCGSARKDVPSRVID